MRKFPLPSRARIRRAIKRTREIRGDALVVDGTPLGTAEALVVDEISVDAVYMILVTTNQKRVKVHVPHDALKRLVTNVVHYFCLDPARERVYVLVTMQYYSFTAQLRAKVKRERKLHHTVRVANARARTDRRLRRSA